MVEKAQNSKVYVEGRKCPQCSRLRVGPPEMFEKYPVCHPCRVEQETQLSVNDVLGIRCDYKHLMDLDFEAQGQPEDSYEPLPNTLAGVQKLIEDWAEHLGVDKRIIRGVVYWRTHHWVDMSHKTRELESML